MSMLLQNGQQVFLNANGNPLVAGVVYFYIPSTTTLKNTWQDEGLTILNTNPIILDSAGRATIWGVGSYRQVVYDSLGNLIWDKVTDDALSQAIARDGSNPPTANLPMGGFRHTGVQNGVAVSDYAALGQSQNSGFLYIGGIAGTNTITGTLTPTLTAYAAGQVFRFVPAGSNTGATTINIDSVGAKNVFAWGAACAGGELVQNVPAEVMYDGTQFNIIGPCTPKITNSLGVSVALNNTATYFTGPSVAQGTVGTWFASGSIIVADNVGAQFNVKLWDGTTVIASANISTTVANQVMQCALSGYITNPAGNIRISAQDITSTNGIIYYNQSGLSKDATLTAIRIG